LEHINLASYFPQAYVKDIIKLIIE